MNTLSINLLPKKSHRQSAQRWFAGIAIVAIVFQSTGGLLPAFAASEPISPASTKTDAVENASLTSITPVQNPTLPQSCGLDIGLAVDQSQSIDGPEMAQMKTALSNFTTAFTGTPTVFSLTSFSTDSALNAPFSLTPSQASTAVLTTIPAIGHGFTNWEAGLNRSASTFDPRPTHSNLIVVATDGSPNHWGYPTADTTLDYAQALEHAKIQANAIKTSGTRIVVVGIGNDTDDPATPAEKLDKMKAISGPNVALTPADITLNTDVIKVTDFTGIGAALSSFASQLCGGKILVQKQLDTNGDGIADIDGTTPNPMLAGWNFTAGNETKTTTNTGSLEFDVQTGTYSVAEGAGAANTTLSSAACQINGQPVGIVDLAGKTISGLVTHADQTISCTFVNSLDTGSIVGTKFNDMNEDGVREPGEPALPGVTITLSNGSTTVTDASGNFTFASVPVGTYTVTETVPAGWVATTPNPVTGVTVVSNQTATVTFGNYLPGKISGHKYDTNEVALNNWQICLVPYYDDSAPRAALGTRNCVLTGSGSWSNGYYEFTNLHAGTYRVYEILQNSWVNVSPDLSGYIVTITSGTGVGQEHASYDFINKHLVPDLAVTKIGPATANTGQQITYTIVASNVGETNADNVTVVDTLPGHLTFVSASNPGVYNDATKTISWNLGTMANNGATQSKTLTVTVLLDTIFPAGQTVLTNTVDISTSSFEPDTSHNHATATTAVPALPTLGLTKTATPNPVAAGQNVAYTMNWSVGGNAAASNLTLTDPLPVNTTFVSAADGGTYNAGTNTVSWNLGTQAPGAFGQVHMVVKVNAPLANGTVITNTATLDAAETDPVTATAPVTVGSGPILSITKTSNVTTFTNPGLFVAYTVTVSNAASATDTAKNVVLKDVLPSGFTFDDSSTSKTLAPFDLHPGESKTFTLNALVGLVTPGTYTNTATAKGDNTAEVKATADVQVRVPSVLGATAEAQLTIRKEVNTKLTNAGKTIRYAVTVENIGNATALNVTITDKLPAGFTFVDGGKATKTFTLGDLPAGQKRSINYEVLVGANVSAGDFTNIAQAQADNVSAVLAEAVVSVKKPEVLAATGTGPIDDAIAGLGLILAAIGIALVIHRRPGEYGA